MKPDDIATAIMNALVQGGSQWLIATLVAFLPVLWTTALMLHLGRPYVLRTLRRCGLRLGADIWWMSYLLIRDAVLLITLGVSWFYFDPNLVATLSFPLTGPLAALFLLLALAVKMTRRVDDDVNAYRLATVFLVIGATLYYIPLVFAIEAGSQDYLSGFGHAFSTVSADTGLNPAALPIMWISLVGVVLVVAWLFMRVLVNANRTMAKRLTKGQGRIVPGPAVGGE